MLDANVAEKLRGITLPPPPSAPPSMWWMLWATLALILILALAFALWRRQRALRWKPAYAQAKAESGAAAQLNALAQVFRRFALSKNPRQEVTQIYGQDWVQFLEQRFGQALDPALAALLSEGIYHDDAYLQSLPAERLFAAAERWFKKVQWR